MKTYGDIFNEFCKKFPNAIIAWLSDGSTVIYIAESEVEE